MTRTDIDRLAKKLDEKEDYTGLAMVRIMSSLDRRLGEIQNEIPSNGKLRLRLLEIFIYGAVGIIIGAVFTDIVDSTLSSIARLLS